MSGKRSAEDVRMMKKNDLWDEGEREFENRERKRI
jgi:hypothetical protein